jgi:hypothetical protein
MKKDVLIAFPFIAGNKTVAFIAQPRDHFTTHSYVPFFTQVS